MRSNLLLVFLFSDISQEVELVNDGPVSESHMQVVSDINMLQVTLEISVGPSGPK